MRYDYEQIPPLGAAGGLPSCCQPLPAFRHKSSTKKFTQLLACLVLKNVSRLDYRGSSGDNIQLRRIKYGVPGTAPK
jgi:hypothetical protein